MAKETPEFILPVTEEEYETAGSKFVTFPASNKLLKDRVGESLFLDVECGMPDWDTPGISLKFPISITEEGPDQGKEDKISTGVGTKAIWKLKELVKVVTGTDLPMKKGADGKQHPALDPMAFVGKPAVGQWIMQAGYPGGDKTQPPTYYPKLVALLPAGKKPSTESLM